MSEGAVETRSVVVEREFSHPAEKLWRALTEPHLIEDWLMKNDFAAIPGRPFSLRGEWGGVLACKVLEVEPKQRLVYTWTYAHEDPAFNLDSVVTFTLTPTQRGTLLRMEQAGFRTGQKQALAGATAGWAGFLDKFEGLLARVD